MWRKSNNVLLVLLNPPERIDTVSAVCPLPAVLPSVTRNVLFAMANCFASHIIAIYLVLFSHRTPVRGAVQYYLDHWAKWSKPFLPDFGHWASGSETFPLDCVTDAMTKKTVKHQRFSSFWGSWRGEDKSGLWNSSQRHEPIAFESTLQHCQLY